MDSLYDLDVGVIYTHERQYIGPLIESLRRAGQGLSMRLVLVDNASREGVAPWAARIEATEVLRNARPLSYAENLNRILAAGRARYSLLLNTDMLFSPAERCPAKMVAFMDRHPRCGLGGCRLYRADGSYGYPARRFPTLRAALARRLPHRGRLDRWADEHLYAARGPHESFVCDWLSGCFLMVRHEAYRQVGPLDTRYVKYFEDVDYARRMSRAGWEVRINGRTYCYHYEQRASRRLFSRDAVRHARAGLRYLVKWGLWAGPPRGSADAGPHPATVALAPPEPHTPGQTLPQPPGNRRAA